MLFVRTGKLLVCVSADHATGAYWRGGRIAHVERFERNEQGLARFREFLAPHPRTPVLVMADAVEEDYRVETLPHCAGGERREMVARRLKQHYRNTPYAGAWLQGRERGRRRDDRHLFAALTDAEIIDEWLRVIQAQALPLAGVYLLPMVSTALPDRLRVRAPNLLMATPHADGLRFTFFRDRQFRVSRLTRDDASDGAGPARRFIGEISNTRLYLHALRAVAPDEELTVLLIDCNDALKDVEAAIVDDNPALECIRVSRHGLCAKLGISERHLADDPDTLHLQLLGLQSHACSIAPPLATLRYRRHRSRRAVYAACAGIAGAATLWSASSAWTALEVRNQTRDVAAAVTTQNARYEQVKRELPPMAVSGEAMKRAVEVSKTLQQNARGPLPLMAAVSEALQSSPDIVLREFGWTYAATDIQKSQSASSPSAPGEQPGTSRRERKQSAYVHGEIRPFRGDHRAAIATIDALVGRLRQNPHVAEVRKIRMPLDVSPSAILSGSTLDRGIEPTNAEFELAIVYKSQV